MDGQSIGSIMRPSFVLAGATWRVCSASAVTTDVIDELDDLA
jgi:hypothetical protein